MILEYLGFKPTMPRFAARLLRALPEAERGLWTFDGERETLNNQAGGELGLRNMFLEYCANKPWARAGLIRKYADLADSLSREIPVLWVAAARNVYPVVRSKFVDVAVKIQQRPNPGTYKVPAAIALTGDLEIRLVYDFGNVLSYVGAELIETWGQSVDDVLARAIANLGRLEGMEWVDSKRGFFQMASPMSFAESMLLLDNLVNQLPFQQTAVLMPSNRGILLAADGRSEQAMQAMIREATRCAQEEPWPMSGTLCTRVDGQWREFTASGDAAMLAHSLFVGHRADYYATQKEALDAMHEATGKDIFTASCTVYCREEARASSCAWAHGVTTLLPVTDWVALVPEDPDADFKHLRWEKMLEVCAAHLLPTDESPTRFLVDSFPSAAEWEALEAESFSV